MYLNYIVIFFTMEYQNEGEFCCFYALSIKFMSFCRNYVVVGE